MVAKFFFPQVMFRTGVTTKSPEGARWTSITTPVGCEVHQLSAGPTGLVWAALLDGRALIRTGVTRDSLSGVAWVEVRSPGDGLRLTHLSVGASSVWAVTHTKQVFFRKGVRGEGAGVSEEMAAGCGWVEMVGRMALVSVTANDQVRLDEGLCCVNEYANGHLRTYDHLLEFVTQ